MNIKVFRGCTSEQYSCHSYGKYSIQYTIHFISGVALLLFTGSLGLRLFLSFLLFWKESRAGTRNLSQSFITFSFNKHSNASLFCKPAKHEEATSTSDETTLELKYLIKIVLWKNYPCRIKQNLQTTLKG